MSKHIPPPQGEALESLTLEAALTPPGDETTLSDLPRLRKEAAEQIELLIALLDATEDTETDTQCDDERIDDDELEPSLGALEGRVSDIPAWRMPDNHMVGEDRELDESDDEPSLGSGAVSANASQSHWSQLGAGTDDREEDPAEGPQEVNEDGDGNADSEPWLGWPEGMAQGQGRWGGTDDRELQDHSPVRAQNRTEIEGPQISAESSYRKFLVGLTDEQKQKFRERMLEQEGTTGVIIR
jgi:hypothetical protein